MLQPSDSPHSSEAQPLKNPKSPDHPAAGKLTAFTVSPRARAFLFAFLFSLQLVILFSARFSFFRPHRPPLSAASSGAASASCDAGRIFVYDLPPFFNKDLIDNCDDLNPWVSPCAALTNAGFGRTAADLAGIVPDPLLTSWFATDQFASELIYHRRVLSHRCRTLDPTSASAFYIPFYAGLAVGKHLWTSNSTSGDRDRACAALLQWIKNQAPWIRSNGADHFIMLGRITWDFRRSHDDDWGGSFLHMPGMANVTRLLIERNPWDDLDVGVPYPTGFHPKSATETDAWQSFVLNRTRPTLFSFAGAARSTIKNDFRGVLLDQCARAGPACESVDCGHGRCGGNGSSSRETVRLFLDSAFCLQPRGDSFTRRSMFDCMVAGAVPVLFWKRSAYVQYPWYLPDDAGEWSVFIDRRAVRNGTASIRGVLEGIGVERTRRMRERVVEMIPRLVYGGAEDGIGGGLRDAFDVAVDGVMRLFRRRREGSEGE